MEVKELHEQKLTHWTGPYGILVPNEVNYIMAKDGYNTLRCNGGQTEMFMENAPEMNEEIYKKKYATYNSIDNKWYYNSLTKSIDSVIDSVIVPQSSTVEDIASNTIYKIAIDVDLIDNKTNFVRHIVRTECLTKHNYKKLICFKADSYEQAVCQYGCDICDKSCSLTNPIWTNSSTQGCDICNNCIEKSMHMVKPLDGWSPGPVYSLQDIVNIFKPK